MIFNIIKKATQRKYTRNSSNYERLQNLKKIYLLFIALAFIVVVGFSGATNAGTNSTVEDSSWDLVAVEIENSLTASLELYKAGNHKKAKGSVSDTYFDNFEESGMETAISIHISKSRTTEVEGMFGAIRGAMTSGMEFAVVESKVNGLIEALHNDAGVLDIKTGSSSKNEKKSPMGLFITSLIIILREGFEAILVVSALAAYLRKSGNEDKVKTIYGGALVAILASIITAVMLRTVIKLTGAEMEALEGVVMLTATAVLFYVSYWLISKVEVGRWQNYIKSKIDGSLTQGKLYALWFAAFLAVYREGAETILFYEALFSSANGQVNPVLAGIGVGTVLLFVIFAVVKYGSIVIPVGPFFAITSTFLYYLAFVFAGKGISELQEANIIDITAVSGFPTIEFMGIYPTVETLTLQGLLIVALVFATVYNFVYKPYMERVTTTRDITHIEGDIKALHDMLEDVSGHADVCQKLSVGTAGTENEEIRKHLIELDSLVHEVEDHLKTLEGNLQDTFSDLEKDLYKGKTNQKNKKEKE